MASAVTSWRSLSAGRSMAHLQGATAGSVALIVVAASGLWYLPVGTLGSLIIMGVVGWEMMTGS